MLALLAFATRCLLLGVELVGSLDEVVAGAFHVNGWVVRLSILLDGVAALWLDSYLFRVLWFR